MKLLQKLLVQEKNANAFYENCLENFEVSLSRPNTDLGQWRIKIQIDDFNIDCQTGYLQIVEDGESSQNLKICNDNRNELQNLYSHEHLMRIRIKMDNCDGADCGKQGVKLSISAQYVCGGTYREPEGAITSPFYPDAYVNSMACIYDIMAPKGSRIFLKCLDFNLSSRGGDKTFFQDLETFSTYHGNDLDGKTLKTKRHTATFYFLSNNVVLDESENYGFNCTYRMVQRA